MEINFKGETIRDTIIVSANTTIDLSTRKNVISFSLKNLGTSPVVINDVDTIDVGDPLVSFLGTEGYRMTDILKINFPQIGGKLLIYIETVTYPNPNYYENMFKGFKCYNQIGNNKGCNCH